MVICLGWYNRIHFIHELPYLHKTHLYSLGTFRPPFSGAATTRMFSSPVTHSCNPLRPPQPAGLTEQSIIVAASKKGPLWHLLSQEASPLLASLFPVMEPNSKSSDRKRRQQQHQAERTGGRGTQRFQMHPAVRLLTIHPGGHGCWGACKLVPSLTPSLAGSGCADRSGSLGYMYILYHSPDLNNHREQKETAACGSCQVYCTSLWSSMCVMPPVWHTTQHQLISTNPGSWKCRLWNNKLDIYPAKKGQKSLGSDQLRFLLRERR